MPSLHLGHGKLKSSDQQEEQQERAQRIRVRRKRERERKEQDQDAKEKLSMEDESHGERVRDISFAVQEQVFRIKKFDACPSEANTIKSKYPLPLVWICFCTW